MVCSLCGRDFAFYTANICLKCGKLNAATSDAEKNIIMATPQCEGCSVIFPYLAGTHCNPCVKQLNPWLADDNLVGQIQESAKQFEGKASQHRLNQNEPKGPQALRALKLKDSETALKQQRKAEIFKMEANLVIYPAGSATCKKTHFDIKPQVAMMPILKKVPGTDLADSALDGLLHDLQHRYSNIPGPKAIDAPPSFERSKVIFNVVGTGNKVHNFPTDSLDFKTIADLHACLKEDGYLSDKDTKNKTITLRVDLYEEESINSDGFDSHDDYESAPITSRKASKSRARPSKAYRASKSLPSSKKRVGPSSRSESERSPPAKRASRTLYTSSFRRPSASSGYVLTTGPLTFDLISFKRTYCITNMSGDVTAVQDASIDNILIGNDWQLHRAAKNIKGTYLGSRFSKFAIRGVYKDQHYVILQSKPFGDTWPTAEANGISLMQELKMLHVGQYFMSSFITRAASCNVELPKLRFNAAGAFLGLAINKLPGPPDNGKPDTRTIVYQTFLAAPYIAPADGFVEQKWSGTNQAGDNKDHIGVIIDAFAHHSLIDSNYTAVLVDLQGMHNETTNEVVLFDPQMHTVWAGEKMHFDDREKGINEFIRSHQCNKMCRAMGMHKNRRGRPWEM